MQHKLTLDFVMSFCRGQVPGHGEDSYCYSFCDIAGLVGVFDGCGGSGARTHDYYSGHTEAYMASRLCSGAYYDWFRRVFPCSYFADRLVKDISSIIEHRLIDFAPPQDETGFRVLGAGVRTLPCTAATAIIQQGSDDSILITAIWAGDSRVYIMDSMGLAQITEDDSTVTDPMLNIYEDGRHTNVLCRDKPVKLHYKTIKMKEPFVVFSATDGCFGYLSTPMEFEGLLLETLLKTKCVADWELELANTLSSIAGDDHTLCLAAYGYGSYATLQNSFTRRYRDIERQYLIPVSNIPVENCEPRIKLWNSYRSNYMRYLKDGPA